ncbi:unnamed protein product [Eruca vesicaria subsp. sativa]|uniref:Uncharacterized protein n=1 Tax=Eruca vesicaria subsp. sativa TaxID=29727 RepID=A0ABC8LY88_ERUVS|nr:unnamed protein product [Eruca vesicaria subsp. sativa]
MAMVVTTSPLCLRPMMLTSSPSCLRPPPDPPPLPFLGLMQHCSFSLKRMMTVLPSQTQSRSPPDPSPNKPLLVETLSPVKPLEPPDPPDTYVSLVPLRIFVSSTGSSLQATRTLDLVFNLSRVSSKLSDGGAALVVIGDTILVYRCRFVILGMGRLIAIVQAFGLSIR